jgi:hypothetical protein
MPRDDSPHDQWHYECRLTHQAMDNYALGDVLGLAEESGGLLEVEGIHVEDGRGGQAGGPLWYSMPRDDSHYDQ